MASSVPPFLPRCQAQRRCQHPFHRMPQVRLDGTPVNSSCHSRGALLPQWSNDITEIARHGVVAYGMHHEGA